MAFLKSFMGRFSGRIDNLVYHDTSHGNTVSTLGNYTSPTDPATISRRTKFKFVIKLSAAIIRLFSLHILWHSSGTESGKALNKVFKKNYPLVSPTLDMAGVVLTDNPMFTAPSPEINMAPNAVNFAVAALGPNQGFTAEETKICAEGVLCLSDAIDESVPAFSFVPIKSPDQNLLTTDPLNFILPIDGADAVTAAKYNTKKVLVVLATKNADGTPVKSSVTFTT